MIASKEIMKGICYTYDQVPDPDRLGSIRVTLHYTYLCNIYISLTIITA